MAETDEKPDAKYVGLWEATVKGVNSLLIAHGAGLVTCLTLLKDYDTNPDDLKGQFRAFKTSRNSWNLLHELAGSPSDTTTKIDAADILIEFHP